MSGTDAILKQVKALTPAEWATLRTKADAWFSLKGQAPASETTDHEQAYLRAMLDELRRRRLLVKKLPLNVVPAPSRAKVSAVWEDLLGSLHRLTPLARLQLAAISSRALADWINAHQYDLTLLNMAYHADKTRVALDRAFPGYLEAGLLPFALRTKNG